MIKKSTLLSHIWPKFITFIKSQKFSGDKFPLTAKTPTPKVITNKKIRATLELHPKSFVSNFLGHFKH